MIRTSKSLSTTMFVLALVMGLGSVVVFAASPLGALRVVCPRWSITTILFWDAALSVLFFVQHSGMIRKPFRGWLGRFLAVRYHPATYATASGVALAAVVLLWQPSSVCIFALTGVPRRMAQGLSLAGLCFFVWGARSLRPFDPLGLAPLAAHLRNQAERASTFVARGPYRWVRHPLYLAVLALIWSRPEMTADGLLYAVLWSGWIVVGARLEEGDLLAEFGEAYRAYCLDVPMLIPWPKHQKPEQSVCTAPRGSSWPGERGEGYVVIQILLIALVLLGPRTWQGLPPWPTSVVRIASPIGIALLTFGLALIVSGIGALGRNLAAVPRPKEGASLVETGPYRIVRHPMYAGTVFIAFGWALAVHGSFTLGYACLVVVFLALKIAREERWLRQEIAGYAAYERRVSRVIPFVY